MATTPMDMLATTPALVEVDTTPEPTEDEAGHTDMFWVGVGCAVFGNFLSSLSFQLQRMAHKNNEKGIPYTRIPQWWLGFLCMALGEVGNFLAYGMAPASLVSPLGAVAVVANAVLSRIVLKEDLSWRTIAGVCVALVGSALIAYGAPAPMNEPSVQDAEDPRKAADAVYDSLITWRAFIYLMVILFSFLCVANPWEWKIAVTKKMREGAVIWNCILCGLMGAITVSASKGVSTALNQGFSGNPDMFVRGNICWLTYVLIIAAVGSIMQQLKYLNEALMHFGSSQVVPVYYVVFTSITISAGMVLFLELLFKPMALGIALFSVGVFMAFFGVYLIATVHGDEVTEAGKHDLRLAQAMSIDPEKVDEMTEQLLEGTEMEGAGGSKNSANVFSRIASLGATGVRETFNEMDTNRDGELDAGDLERWKQQLGEEEEEQKRLADELREYFWPEGAGTISFEQFEEWYNKEFDGELGAVHEAHKQSLRKHHLVLAMRIQSKSSTLAVVGGTPGLQMFKTLFLTNKEVLPELPPIPELQAEDSDDTGATEDIENGIGNARGSTGDAGGSAKALPVPVPGLQTSSSLRPSALERLPTGGIATGALQLSNSRSNSRSNSIRAAARPALAAHEGAGEAAESVMLEIGGLPGKGREGRREEGKRERLSSANSHRSAASEPDPSYTSPSLRPALPPAHAAPTLYPDAGGESPRPPPP